MRARGLSPGTRASWRPLRRLADAKKPQAWLYPADHDSGRGILLLRMNALPIGVPPIARRIDVAPPAFGVGLIRLTWIHGQRLGPMVLVAGQSGRGAAENDCYGERSESYRAIHCLLPIFYGRGARIRPNPIVNKT